MVVFTQDQLEAIAGALGDASAGLTGTEIQYLLASSKMADPGPITKRIRIYNAFAESQNTKKNRTNILEFIRLAMKPARLYSRATALRTHACAPESGARVFWPRHGRNRQAHKNRNCSDTPRSTASSPRSEG